MTKQDDAIEPEVLIVQQEQSTALAETGMSGGGLPAPQTREDMEAMLKRADLAIEFQNRIKTAALRLTNENDWCHLGKKFFLENTGAKKMMQAFGVACHPDGPATTERFKDDKGEYIVVTVPMRAVWHGAEVSEVGMCSTRDKLLGKTGGGWRPLSEVSIVNVTLKAQTSAIRRAVTSVLALNPSEQDMVDAGLNLDKIKEERGVSYGKGVQGGSTDSKALTARKAEVGRKMIEMYGDKERAGEALERMTSFKNKEGKDVKGKTSLNRVSEKQFGYVETDVNKEYVDFQKAQEAQGKGEVGDA